MGLVWIGIGIAAAGYFIGEGLNNFQNPGYSLFSSFGEEREELLIPEKDLHVYLGIKKTDSKSFLEEYPDIPHIKISGSVYVFKEGLDEWVKKQAFKQS
ncbi:DNA-binding protein [Bacillus kexueae]|uniref:DNA-binding protein n=1 Tax=Aeribacillus kexueae TaxID=2078952 RepID=UPI001FAF526A|nr:DNA-binding protein [Bacillus kexueae]